MHNACIWQTTMEGVFFKHIKTDVKRCQNFVTSIIYKGNKSHTKIHCYRFIKRYTLNSENKIQTTRARQSDHCHSVQALYVGCFQEHSRRCLFYIFKYCVVKMLIIFLDKIIINPSLIQILEEKIYHI